jgi:PAS domain-containing protein
MWSTWAGASGREVRSGRPAWRRGAHDCARWWGGCLHLRIKDGFRRAQAYCQALGQAERNVRLVADSSSEMVVAYDMHRSLTYANSGAEKLTGYGHAELQRTLCRGPPGGSVPSAGALGQGLQ